MQPREKQLLYGLIGIAVLFLGGRFLDSSILAPMRERQETLTQLEKDVETKTNTLITLARKKKNLDGWKRRSLPLDKSTDKKRLDAINAQRLYRDWLHDLGQLSGFEELTVQASRLAPSRDSVFVSVGVTVEAEARYEQLCRFLDRFYRTDLMHRVSALRVQSQGSEDDPVMAITLEAEGLAIAGAPEKRLLFAQTVLAEELTEDSTTVIVVSAGGFPTEPGFFARIQDEIVTVTAINGSQWTVERARDGTRATTHAAGAIVEHMPLLPDVQPRDAETIKKLLASNPFVKPAPPVQYKPRLAPLSEKTHTRGRPLEFSVVVMGYDPARGRPEFTLAPPLVSGSRIDRSTGRFTWTPDSSQKAGTFKFPFVVKHPSAPGGQLTDTITVTLRDPNTAPRLVPRPAPTVFIGRPWELALSATDRESPAEKLTFKLGENPPKGLTLSPAGTLSWTPDETTEVGTINVPVVITDDGSQPMSATVTVPLTVQDDAATFTYLTTIFSIGNSTLAKLYDRSQDKQIELRVGSKFAVADVQGVVTQINRKQLQFTNPAGTHVLQIGQSLREFSTLAPAVTPAGVAEESIPDATRPENAEQQRRRADDDSEAPAIPSRTDAGTTTSAPRPVSRPPTADRPQAEAPEPSGRPDSSPGTPDADQDRDQDADPGAE